MSLRHRASRAVIFAVGRGQCQGPKTFNGLGGVAATPQVSQAIPASSNSAASAVNGLETLSVNLPSLSPALHEILSLRPFSKLPPPYPSLLPPFLSPLRLRPFSTHVGHGSGGRVEGPHLHEPPETHPFAVKGLNHIALAVPSLKEAAEHYRTVFGAQVSDPHPLSQHGVTVVFVHVGSCTIELMEPLGKDSPIAKFLEKHPRGGLHHLGFTGGEGGGNNIDIASQHVSEEGVRLLGAYSQRTAQVETQPGGAASAPAQPTPQMGAHGNPVVFLDPRDNLGVLCELEQVFCHER